MLNFLQAKTKTFQKCVFACELHAIQNSFNTKTNWLQKIQAQRSHPEQKGFNRFSSRKYSTFDTVEALKDSGFPFETHEVTTEDGYILTLHRIPRSKNGNFMNNGEEHPDRLPILLQHGLWSSSGDWIVTGTSHSLAFILSQNGFDVWLGNTRGNLYSRKHQSLCPNKNSKEFWNFSWHEMGYFDLPAMIDHILNVTKNKQINYVGHSLGTTMCFVLLSMKPQYNEKIKVMFALAPIVYLKHLRNDLLQNLAGLSDSLFQLLQTTGYHSFLPRNGIISFVDSFLSRNSDRLVTNAPLILSNLSGYASDSVKNNLKEVILAHIAAGTSLKVLAHFAQCVRYERTFRQFDYGLKRNQIVYGQKEPPNYQLSNIRVPVVLFYSREDWLSTWEDVEQLADTLELNNKENLIRKKIDLINFNHLDFIWGSIARLNVFNHILTIIKTF